METTIWIEKYRPQIFSEVKGQSEIVSRLKAFVEHKNMPHLLFSGPPGTGKSTNAMIIAKTLFGEAWRDNFLELNASDERGIDIVRNKVKDFARTRAVGEVPFKIIFLDECDALTKEAQQALRRTMENYTKTCRFILSANYSSKIIDPIQSRCAVFRFRPLEKEDMFSLIDHIAKKENLVIDSVSKEALYLVSFGDCRKVENILQSVSVSQNKITADLIYSVASFARPTEIIDVLKLALENKFIDARKKLLSVMLTYGLSGTDVIKQIQQEIWNLSVSDMHKVELIDKCGEIEFRLVEGSDEYVQLEALLAHFCFLGSKK